MATSVDRPPTLTFRPSTTTKLGTFRKRTARTRPFWIVATVRKRPDGTSTTTSVDGPVTGTSAASIGPGDQRDRAVPAGGAVAGVVKEDDAQLSPVIHGIRDKSAVHVGVPAWFEDEQLPDVVEMVERIAPLLEDGSASQRWDAAADDPKRLPCRVIVDGGHHQLPARDRNAHRLMVAQPGARPTRSIRAPG